MLTEDDVRIFGLLLVVGVLALAFGIRWFAGSTAFFSRFGAYAFGGTIGAVLLICAAIMFEPLYGRLMMDYLELIYGLCSKMGFSWFGQFVRRFLDVIVPAIIVYLGMTFGLFFVWWQRRRVD